MTAWEGLLILNIGVPHTEFTEYYRATQKKDKSRGVMHDAAPCDYGLTLLRLVYMR